MSERCDCFPWNPFHEPRPACRWFDCTATATGIMRHRTAGPHACDHLICDAHKGEADAVKDHDFVPLHVAYPNYFHPPGEPSAPT